MPEIEGHAFICYVREDSHYADRVTSLLKSAGIPVWRDTESLWPGEDWRHKIREAITKGAFAFLPIFSPQSVSKGISGQHEELYLAAEEMRKRPPDAVWMLPVRFDECDLPKLDLGGGRLLDSIQRTDLFGKEEDRQAERLVHAVQRILTAPTPAGTPTPLLPAVETAPAGYLDTHASNRVEEIKSALRHPAGDIRMYDLLVPLAETIHDLLADTQRFPTEGAVSAMQIASQVEDYWRILDPLLDTLVVGGMWSTALYEHTWSEVIERVARARGGESGNVVRLEVRWFPLLPMLYAGGLAAVYRSNFAFLRTIAVDATVNDLHGRIAAVARAHPFQAFKELPISAQILALRASGEVVDQTVVDALANGSRGKRYTPVSDHLHDRLRPKFARLIPEDDRYADIFDRLEIIIALLIADERALAEPPAGEHWRGPWIPAPVGGRFTWRDRYAKGDQLLERRLRSELVRDGDRWPPLAGGLFGGSVDRALAAFGQFLDAAEAARSRRG